MTAPKYDRIVPLIGLVLLGLGVALLLESRLENTPLIRPGGDLPALPVSWAIMAALVVLVSTGADLLARAHPQMQHRALPAIRLGPVEIEIAPRFWVLPSLTIVAAFAFSRLFREDEAFLEVLLSLIASAGLLAAVLVGQHYSLDRREEIRERWLVILHAIAYLDAFALFSAIYAQRMRSLYSAPLIALIAGMLAYVLLRRDRGRNLGLLAVLVGLVLAETTWALNYWAIPFLMGGTLLLGIFYAIVGILQHDQAGTLERRVLWEFAGLGGLVLAIMAAAMLMLSRG